MNVDLGVLLTLILILTLLLPCIWDKSFPCSGPRDPKEGLSVMPDIEDMLNHWGLCVMTAVLPTLRTGPPSK